MYLDAFAPRLVSGRDFETDFRPKRNPLAHGSAHANHTSSGSTYQSIFGADGKLGGTGEDADITSWQ